MSDRLKPKSIAQIHKIVKGEDAIRQRQGETLKTQMGMREEEDHTEEVGRRKGWGKKYRGGEEDEGQVFVKMSK